MRKSSNVKTQIANVRDKKNTKLPWFFLIAIILIYLLFINLRNSAFFQKKERVNVVYSGKNIAYFSLGLIDRVNYFIPFFPDLEVIVPGGYGYYRLGALAKLASLEKDKDLFKKTYSLATSSLVDFYFYPSASSDRMEIFFGKEKSNFELPGISILFFGESNANYFDRLFLYFIFLGKTSSDFRTLDSNSTNDQDNRVTFSPDEFQDAAQGVFYKTSYRNEQRNVQIMYTSSYKTALQLSRILEGEGIRVVDLTSDNSKKPGKCEVVEEGKFSETAKSVSQFFGCQLSVGKTEAYDIILRLGEVEKKWLVE